MFYININREPVPAKDIFGAAKPVDTAAREKEIEAKLHGQDQSDSSRPPQKISSGKVETKSIFENDTNGRNLKTI